MKDEARGFVLYNFILYPSSILEITEVFTEQPSAVFVFMAVNAEVFPIRAIRGIIPVISIFMVYR